MVVSRALRGRSALTRGALKMRVRRAANSAVLVVFTARRGAARTRFLRQTERGMSIFGVVFADHGDLGCRRLFRRGKKGNRRAGKKAGRSKAPPPPAVLSRAKKGRGGRGRRGAVTLPRDTNSPRFARTAAFGSRRNGGLPSLCRLCRLFRLKKRAGRRRLSGRPLRARFTLRFARRLLRRERRLKGYPRGRREDFFCPAARGSPVRSDGPPARGVLSNIRPPARGRKSAKARAAGTTRRKMPAHIARNGSRGMSGRFFVI